MSDQLYRACELSQIFAEAHLQQRRLTRGRVINQLGSSCYRAFLCKSYSLLSASLRTTNGTVEFESSSYSSMGEQSRWGEIRRQLHDSSKLKNCRSCGQHRFKLLGTEASTSSLNLVSAANDGCQSCLIICTALEHFRMLWEPSPYSRIIFLPWNFPSVRLMTSDTDWKELDFYIQPRKKLNPKGKHLS